MVAHAASPEAIEYLRKVVREQAERELCKREVLDFAARLTIRSDDPMHPEPQPLRLWPAQVDEIEAIRDIVPGSGRVILKARQLGFTTGIVAPYMLWRAMYHGWAVAYLSVDQAAARKQIDRIEEMWTALPPHVRTEARFTADAVTFEGGGSITAFPSTDHAGISFTFQLVVMDEAAFHAYGRANYDAIRPTANRAVMVILSTADPTLGPYGFFHDLYWASKRGETGLTAQFVPWSSRPDRDAAWYERERRAYATNPEALGAYYPETDAEAFVGRSGLVYHMFREDRHVVSAHPWEWDTSHRKVGGVDFGGGDPTACGVYGMDGRQHWHQFGEMYERGVVDVFDIVAFFGQWSGPGRIMCDPSQGTAIATLDKALAGTGWRALAADNKRGEGMEDVAFLLDNDRLTFHSSCRGQVAEFPGYRWAERTDPNSKERYATSTPVDNHGDAKDALRYAMREALAHMRQMSTMATHTLSGRPMPRHAV